MVRIAMDEGEYASLETFEHWLTEASGVTWYWDRENRQMVRRSRAGVQRFDVDNGVLSGPAAMCSTKTGVVILGAHQGIAAASTFDGNTMDARHLPDTRQVAFGKVLCG